MGSAEFILAVNIGVSGLLAAAFFALSTFERTGPSARWFAAAYVCGIAYFVIEFVIPILDAGTAFVTVAHIAFLCALACFTVGLARFYDYPLSMSQLALVFAVCVAIKIGSDLLPRESMLRQFLYQAPYAVMQGICAVLVLSTRRNRLDIALVALLAVSGAHFLAKPFIALAVGGVGARPADYSSTVYALISQSTGAVLSVAVALLLLVILVTELLGRITTASQTDVLSGLLNRRGFETKMAPLVETARRTGLPLSLIVCDLDRFKSVNDSYGHATGDRLIEAFAGSLLSAVGERHLVGRIGGEEFAILAYNANLGSARLLAESVRIAFTRTPIADMPATERFSASFGVAEMGEGETMDDLFRRADHALYRAKQDGRDCVRTSDAFARGRGLGRQRVMATDPGVTSA
jgi:diguanylate cyclase (GGDEF)-like protein